MAITKTQGYKLDSPQQNFVRDSFATVNAMVAYNTALLPDVFHTMVEENGKMYTYYVGNTVDATLGKWREVADIEGVMFLKGVWSSTTMPNCSDYKIGDTWIVGSDSNYIPYRSSITWEVGSSWTNYEYSLAQKFWAVYSEAGVILCNGEVVTGITATTITTSSSTYTFGTDEIVITASTTVSIPLNSGDELVCISSNCTTGQIWGILNNKQTVTSVNNKVGNVEVKFSDSQLQGTTSIGGCGQQIMYSALQQKFVEDTTSIGSATNPIFQSNGVTTASTATVGTYYRPVYMSGGVLTPITCDIGDVDRPVYFVGGAPISMQTTFGSDRSPVYFSSGRITALSGEVVKKSDFSISGTTLTITL